MSIHNSLYFLQLKLYGFPIREGENIGMNGPQFLENMMKLNEQVASLTDEKEKKLLKQKVEGNADLVKITCT